MRKAVTTARRACDGGDQASCARAQDLLKRSQLRCGGGETDFCDLPELLALLAEARTRMDAHDPPNPRAPKPPPVKLPPPLTLPTTAAAQLPPLLGPYRVDNGLSTADGWMWESSDWEEGLNWRFPAFWRRGSTDQGDPRWIPNMACADAPVMFLTEWEGRLVAEDLRRIDRELAARYGLGLDEKMKGDAPLVDRQNAHGVPHVLMEGHWSGRNPSGERGSKGYNSHLVFEGQENGLVVFTIVATTDFEWFHATGCGSLLAGLARQAFPMGEEARTEHMLVNQSQLFTIHNATDVTVELFAVPDEVSASRPHGASLALAIPAGGAIAIKPSQFTVIQPDNPIVPGWDGHDRYDAVTGHAGYGMLARGDGVCRITKGIPGKSTLDRWKAGGVWTIRPGKDSGCR